MTIAQAEAAANACDEKTLNGKRREAQLLHRAVAAIPPPKGRKR